MQQECVDQKTLQKLTDALIAMPDGVQVMSAEIPGLVQTSLNNGVLKIDEKRCFFVTSIRSSVKSQKEALIEKAVTITRLAGGITKIRGDYPGWEYRQNSPFRELCLKIYREMYKKEPIVEAIHAGVECGILIEKRSELDCVSIGPDMESIHTTEEKLSIASVQRVWEYILRVLSAKEE
jgi:dipeptidase D